MLAAIPYTTFESIDIGPFAIRTFGFMVGLGVIIGAWFAARYLEKFGITREESYRLATRLVVAGVIGARVSWVLSHLDQIDSVVDPFAVWEGGLQFTGGFIGAILIGLPTFRRWSRLTRWRSIDGYVYGLTIGLAFGRIGCWSVGEHFGTKTSFLLGARYEGGTTREPIEVGDVIHQTALYEFIHLMVLFALLSWVLYRRRQGTYVPGTAIGVFAVWYGVLRWSTDFLRANDNTVLGMTGAQWAMVALFAVAGPWIWFRVRPANRALLAAESA